MQFRRRISSLRMSAPLPSNVHVPKNDADHAVLESLRPLKGKQFDDAYIATVGLQGHKEAIAAFQREATDGQVAQIKDAAAKALPTIQDHYQDGTGAGPQEGNIQLKATCPQNSLLQCNAGHENRNQ